MRTNLIMHFCCSECGNRLRIRTESEESVENKSGFGNLISEHPKEPTGAECRYIPPVQIEPCRYCIEKYTGPAKRLLESIKEINEI